MKSKLLLPHRYKMIGIVLLIPSLFLGVLVRFFEFEPSFLTLKRSPANGLFENINLTDEIALTGLIISLLFIAFAQEKEEDEFISRVRLESLQWAVLINYVLLLIATWIVHGLSYIDVMMYNMLTVLILFIVRFQVLLRRNKSAHAENALS